MSSSLDVPLEHEDRLESASSARAYFSSLKESWEVIRWVLSELRTPENVYWSRLMLAWQGAAAIVETAMPALMMLLIATLQKDQGNWQLVAGLFALYYFVGKPVKSFFTEARRVCREKVIGITMGRLDDRMVSRFFEKSVGQHQRDGSKLSVANIDKGRMRTINIQNIVMFEFLPSFALLLCSLIALLILSPLAGAVMIAVFAIHLSFSIFMNNWIRGVADNIDAAWRARNRYLFNRLRHVERVKTTGVEPEELTKLDDWYQRIVKHDYALWRSVIRLLRRRENITDAGQAVAMGIGVYGVYTGSWDIAMLFPLYMWIESIADHFWRISDIEQQINYNLPAVRSMMKVLSMPSDVDDIPGAVPAPSGPIGVTFNNVSYSYDARKDNNVDSERYHTLRNISFSVRPGSKTAIVGPSGAGKTSIMKLLLRNMDPQSGQVLINGTPLTHIQRNSWLKTLGYIPQKDMIFDGTLRSNILYGLEFNGERMSDDEIWEMIRPVQADFGSRLEKGLDTEVGENGLKLSGGQAQRVMIAAAVVRKPRILIIDEATASLDSTTEKGVQEGFKEVLNKDVTAIIISHRLSTIRPLVDQIIVLRPSDDIPPGGSQIEAIAKNFEEAYRISPTFRRLADDQDVVINAKAA